MRPSLRQTPTLLRRAAAARNACLATTTTIEASAPATRWQSSSSNNTTPPHNTPPQPHPNSSSVNAAEISHFNALAATWWDAHGSSRALHLMNPLRHDFINACRSSSPTSSSTTTAPPSDPKLRYLDIGCGGGIFAESATRLPTTLSVTAVDPSTTILAVARAHARKDPALTPQKLQYINASIETLPQDQFDVVSLFEVIEHVDQPADFLDRAEAFVKPGGWLVLSTIARTWTSWFTTNLVAEDIVGIVPKGTHDWYKYINEHEMRAHFEGRSVRRLGITFLGFSGWCRCIGMVLGLYDIGRNSNGGCWMAFITHYYQSTKAYTYRAARYATLT
ncbi:S-adenosyl-L-methionine-dependent methyltransferase [Bombardia bombarda]|uniref:Ubiquinone biosynthesis O-methyltransferase, mitochondrial n=1 Tax=Bombardia bombarda TaxID=252184 RepID=A0AA40C8I9_9PEZI|nr:S-adenosyl-L-methionine-dependent methyltransferase [Bombardia bombarda]